MTDDEDQVDEELGEPDPEATAAEAMGTLDPTEAVPGASPAPPPMVSGQPDQELPPAVPIGAPPAAIAAPAMVPAGTHAVKGTRTTSGMAPNADLVGGQAAEQQVFRDEKKLAADQAALQGEAARIEQERAEKIAEETARQNAEIMAEQQHQADLAAQRAEQFSRDIDELKRSKPPGGFTEWAGGKKAAASLSIALGGMVAGRTGTANLALADVNREVDQEARRYQQGIENQFNALAKRQGLNHELDNQAKDALARGEARKIMALDSLNKYADAQLKALGIPAAQQAGIKAQLGFDKQAAQAQQKYGQILGTKVTDTTKFTPIGSGGGGGGGAAVVNLVKMAEDGAKRSEIVDAARRAGLPEKLWKNQVDLAFVEREKAGAAKEKAAGVKEADNDKRAVRDPQGNVIGYAGGARPDVKGIQDRLVNFESAEDFLKTLLRNHDHVPMGSDWHNGVLAIAATTTANPSDATTKHEAGTLKGTLGLISQDAVKTKLADIQKRKAAFMKQLRPVAEVEGGGAEKAPAAAAEAPEVRVTKDGRVLMKGPDGKIVEVAKR